ncbi:MAG: sulfite reductase [Candidatus Omnitrophica bacterium CG11_big_fil_rev_8_21_14_0_20_42_13]|uniref:Sulfite reductase n=1 Tax=Candidatus Ghiorseimicrobium undicola TaxID=1974746 RepID=A0A2H0LXK2_9BACT|nr:MAG: sulfite reductase [Candidatus Omnitrophica bacterium CG11_big_fil_rev_8_21_14_0_20_42_13]
MNFIARKIIHSSLDKEGNKFIALHFPGGVLAPADLRRIADACDEFGESKIKLGSEIIIGGVSDKKRNEECRKKLNTPTFKVAAFCVRPVKVCAGGYICGNNLQDSFSLGTGLDKRFHGIETPFKLVISVSGCPRCCAESKVKDIGIVASSKGYDLFVGGAAGARPRIAVNFARGISEEEAGILVERIIKRYQKGAKFAERLGLFIERIGLDKFKEEIGIK